MVDEDREDSISLTKMQLEVDELRPIKEKVRLVEAELVEKDRQIEELETEIHGLKTDLYNYDSYIEKLEKTLDSKAEDAKATIAKIKTKLTYQIDVSQLPRIQAVAAFAKPGQPIRLLFNSVTGVLMEVGL